MADVGELIEDEWYIVRYSGEIPEIAYNSTIYYLTRSVDGPQVVLSQTQIEYLKKAAVDRFEEIILRDVIHENVGKSIYRGIERSACNYTRFVQFCGRQELNPESIKLRIAETLVEFLHLELKQLESKDYLTVINCSFNELAEFLSTLGLPFLPEYSAFKSICQNEAR